MNWLSFEATASVAYKEFLHIYRDRRLLLLVLLLPPLFTLLFGHAFETSELTDVPCMLINRDNTARSQEFIERKPCTPMYCGQTITPNIASACAGRRPPSAHPITPVRNTITAPAASKQNVAVSSSRCSSGC